MQGPGQTRPCTLPYKLRFNCTFCHGGDVGIPKAGIWSVTGSELPARKLTQQAVGMTDQNWEDQ